MANQPEKIATPTGPATPAAGFDLLAYFPNRNAAPRVMGQFATEAEARKQGDWLVSHKGSGVTRYEVKPVR